MEKKALLAAMSIIAQSIIKPESLIDFTEHDTDIIDNTNGETTFIWFVRETGTGLYLTNKPEPVIKLIETLDYHDKAKLEYCLYVYDGKKLFPTLPKFVRDFATKALTPIPQNYEKPKLAWLGY